MQTEGPVTSKTSPLCRELSRLSNVTSQAMQAITKLEQKLAPLVCVIPTPALPSEDKPNKSVASDVVTGLACRNSEIAQLLRRINQLTQSVEV